jgi:hypothetical protein
MPLEVSVEFQGNLLKASTNCNLMHGLQSARSERAPIRDFSRKSRNRLIQKFARLSKQKGKSVFLTLTYPRDYPNPQASKTHLDTFLKRLARQFPLTSGFWRLEFQERGAPHFHLILFGLPFVDKSTIQQMWGEIIGHEKPFTRIELIRGWHKLMSYVSKYVAKEGVGTYIPAGDRAEGDSGFNHLPYLTGRFWGCHNKALIPWADLMVIQLPAHIAKTVFHDLRRAAQHKYKNIRRNHEGLGFFLLVGDVDLWRRYVEYLTGSAFSIRRAKIDRRNEMRVCYARGN